MTRHAAAGLLLAASLAVPVLASGPSPQFRAGEATYAETCAACHGEAGRGGSGYANPIWGQGAQLAKYRTAAGLFEYHQLMMPFDDPSRVSDEAKWAATLFILVKHGTMQPDGTLGAGTAASVIIR